MPTPVLVVHGVANRDENAFRKEVQDVQGSVGANYQLIPVWWADLGGKTDFLQDTLPDMGGITVRGEGAGIAPEGLEDFIAATAGGRTVVRSEEHDSETVIRAAQGQLGTESAVRSDEASGELAQAIRDALPETRYLRILHNDAVLEAAGRAIGAAVNDQAPDGAEESSNVTRTSSGDFFGGQVQTRSVKEKLGNLTKSILNEVDQAVGAALGQVLGDVNQSLRGAWAGTIGCFLGDILAYQRKQAEIQERLFLAIRDKSPGWGTQSKPISVVAHSLGGVVAFDAATRAAGPLWIDGFVTFGSQASFFEVLDPRSSLAAYSSGHPISLPATIARWTNLWEPLDVLAFTAAKVFRLHSGVTPTDVRTTHQTQYGLATHSSYWHSNELSAAIRQTIP